LKSSPKNGRFFTVEDAAAIAVIRRGDLMKEGESQMKKLLFKIALLALVVLIPAAVLAEVDVKVRINIPLPPPIIFRAPPEVVVIPETYVYAVPDVDADIFFYSGWWWRPWEGRWYRSHYYDRGWAYYDRVPAFYRNVPPGWRNDYRDRRWKGREWDQRRIPHRDAEKNWRGWERNKHWEKENNWGVRAMDQRPPGQQKKFRERNDGPPREEGHGPQGGPGRGHQDRDGGDRR
jgi:hypothetical protein